MANGDNQPTTAQLGAPGAYNPQPIIPPPKTTALEAPAVSGPTVSEGPRVVPVPVVPPHVSRLAQFGHLASSLLGKQYDYQVDPKTGQTIPIEVKQKPGDVFRHIVAGAILGGAAAASRPAAPGTGFLGGFSTGGAAAMEADKSADTERRKRAQEQFTNQMKVRTEDREDTLAKAQIAHMHIQDLHADAQMDLIQQEHLEKLNQYNNSILEVVKEKGAPSRIVIGGQDINATPNNGAAFAKAYNANPKAFDAPDGYYRIHTQTVDNSGLIYRMGQVDEKGNVTGRGWFDADGNQVDMSTRTTHHFYDIPKSVMGEHIKKSGKEWNSIAGYKLFPDDEKMYDGTLQDAIGLKTIGVKTALEQNKANLEVQQVRLEIERVKLESQRIKTEIEKGNRTDMLAAYETNKQLMDSAKARLRDAGAELDPEEKKQALADMQEATERMREIQEKLYPKTALPSPSGAVDIAALQKQVPWDKVGADQAAIADKSGKPAGMIPRTALDGYKARGYTEIPRPSGQTAPITNPTNLQQVVMIQKDGTRITTTPEGVGAQMRSGAKVSPESQAAYDAWWNATQKTAPAEGSLE